MPQKWEFFIDESGEFEKSANPQPPARLIGGVLIPPELKVREQDVENALKPIRERYFPGLKKIHISEKSLGHEDQQAVRDAMLNVYKRTMAKAKFAFIYDMSVLSEDPTRSGAQLYRNMLVNLLQSVVFYHPFFGSSDQMALMLAHRRYSYSTAYEAFLAGQGYLKLKDEKGKTEFSAITQADLVSIMNAVRKSLRFVSRRPDSYRVLPYSAWDSPFMEVADWVCNATRYLLLTNRRNRDFYRAMHNHFNQNPIFCSASDYDLPRSLLDVFHRGNFAEFLAGYYRRPKQAPFADNALLYPALNESLRRIQNDQWIQTPDVCDTLIGLADEFLQDRLFDRLDDVKRLLGLLEPHFKKGPKPQDVSDWDPLAYRYHDAGLRHANHTGNVVKGVLHRDRGIAVYHRLKAKTLIMVRSYHEFLNRASIVDANEFAFKRAIARLEPIRAKEGALTDLLKEGRNEIYGKISGSMAQNFAFLEDVDTARHHFEIAREHLGSPNFQQASYRGHMALDIKDEIQYQKELCELFNQAGFNGFDPLFKICLANASDYAFSLHLLLKGLLTFSADVTEIKSILNAMEKANLIRLGQNHPWELIFTVWGRLLAGLGKPGQARAFWDKAAGFAKSPDQLTFIMLGHHARAQIAISWLDQKDYTRAREVMIPVENTFKHLAGNQSWPGIFNPNRIADEDGIVRDGWFDEVGRRFLSEFHESPDGTLRDLAEAFVQRFTFNYW